MLDFYASDVCQPYYRATLFFGRSVPGHSLAPNFAPTYSAPETYFVGELPPEVYTQNVLDSAKGTTAVVLISRDSSEASDYSPDMKPYDTDSFTTVPVAPSEYERAMIQMAKENSNGEVVVLINSDMAMEIEELKQDDGKVTVTNTGSMAGKCVAQLYVQSPYTENGLEKAAVQLLDFWKTEALQPSESTTLRY